MSEFFDGIQEVTQDVANGRGPIVVFLLLTAVIVGTYNWARRKW